MASLSNIFWRCFVSFVKFSYWSKFQVNIITGSGVITIFFYKGLTRNLGIGNALVGVLPNIWRVRSTKFGTNAFNEMLLNAVKGQAFTVSELLQENQLGGGGVKSRTHPPQIRVNVAFNSTAKLAISNNIASLLSSPSTRVFTYTFFRKFSKFWCKCNSSNYILLLHTWK